MVIYSIVMVVVFPLGVPAILGWTLWRKRRALYPRNFENAIAVVHGGPEGAKNTVLVVHSDRVLKTLEESLQQQVGPAPTSLAVARELDMSAPNQFADDMCRHLS
jgi:hypothetical protein